MTIAILLIIRRLTGKPKPEPLPPHLRGALSPEELADYEEQEKNKKLKKKGPHINPEKKTDYQKLTHDKRFDNIAKDFGKQEKSETENKKNPETSGGTPVFAMVSPEAEKFLEKNEEKFEATKKESEKLQKGKEETKTNFQKNLDKLVLTNTIAILKRDNKGKLKLLAIDSLMPIEDAIDELKTKPEEEEPQAPPTESPKITKRKP